MYNEAILPPSGLAALRWLGLAGLVMLLPGCAGGSRSAAEPLPSGASIVILDIDTLRADHLGCYGYHRDTSPNLDRLAAESVRFDWTFSQAPNTPPSQTSILTGLYPSVHGMIEADDRVPDGVETLAEVLATRGYRTAAFVDGGYMSPTFNIGQGFALYDDHQGRGLATIGPAALGWMRSHHEEPFLLLVHTYDVHTPYHSPEPFHSLFVGEVAAPTPGFEANAQQLREARRRGWKVRNPLPSRDVEYAKALYDGGIRYVDDWIGSFLEEFRRLGLDRRAILVVISDHGEEFQEHGSVLHERLFSPVTRIPLLVRLPDAARAGVVEDVVQAIDLMPTLLDLLNVAAPSAVQGTSLRAAMWGEKRRPRPAISESPYFGRELAIAYRDLRYLSTRGGREPKLFEFRQDPLEQRDLSSARRAAAVRLQEALERWQRRIERGVRWDAEAAAPLDPQVDDQLRALGYVR